MWGVSYWVIPLISGLMWLGMLIAMLVVWNTGNPPRPIYPSMSEGQTIAYISDVGAYGLKPLFITGAVITAIFLDLSLLAERWLRHSGRLAKNRTKQERVVSYLSILCAIAGTVGLIGLSIADTYNHSKTHRAFLAVFIVGYVLSAIFVCWEYQRLGIHFREHRVLRASFWTKLLFIIVEVALAIAFGITSTKDKYNAAAVLEWAISFIFTFYIFSFFIDLIPAVRRNKVTGKSQHNTQMAEEANDEEAGAYLEQVRSRDSMGRRFSRNRAVPPMQMQQRMDQGYVQSGYANGPVANGNMMPPQPAARRY